MNLWNRFGWPGLVAVCLVGLVAPTGVLAQNLSQGLVQTRPASGAILAAPKLAPTVVGAVAATAAAKTGRAAGVKDAAAAPVAADGVERVTLGQAVVPLYGPWRFSVGDSPVDPVTHQMVWAEPGFDDSHWEMLT